MLGILETVVALLVLVAVGTAAWNVLFKARKAEGLIEQARPYEARTTDFEKTLLILGDSTGVGVGATNPEDTVAAKLAFHIGATYVENQAKSGAAVADLSTQLQHTELSHYHFILIQIGGNDIIAFHDTKGVAKELARILNTLPDAERVVLMSAGNVGGASILPWIARPFYTWKTLQYHKAFTQVANEKGITYVNLYKKPWEDPFIKDTGRYLSADGLHPSSEGYALWFEEVKKAIE